MKAIMYGLGRIGLPIALTCAKSGIKVTGIDVNRRLINTLREKKAPFHEEGLIEALEENLYKNFFPKLPEENIGEDYAEADYVIIAVGTGFARFPDEPNLSTLYSIIGQIIAHGIRNKTVILRVTLPIGTTEMIIKLIERKTGLVEGEDFFFAFVPERIMEGKAMSEEASLPKVIGSTNDECYHRVEKFFLKIGGNLTRVTNPRTAEFIKLIDNSWRNTKFSFSNELAYLAESNNIDVTEAINTANEGYERNMIPRPGPVSGYCLGKDPYILELAFKEISERRGFNSLWYYGRRANDWLYEKIMDSITGKKVLILGLSFKEDIDDYRYSHSVNIIKRCIEGNHDISVYDPFLNVNYYTKIPDDIYIHVKPVKRPEDIDPTNYDSIVISVRHEEFITEEFKNKIGIALQNGVKIIDLWNIYREFLHLKGYISLGSSH